MSNGTPQADWVTRPIHHLLIAAYPILFLLANNLGETDPREGVVPTIAAIGSAAVLFLLLRFARVPSRRAALIVSVLAIIVLTYGHVAGALSMAGVSGLRVLAAWLAVGVVSCIVIAVIPGDLRTLTGLLNALSGVLVAVSLAPIVSHLGTDSTVYAGGQGLPAPSGGESSAAEPGSGEPMRDIYYRGWDRAASPGRPAARTTLAAPTRA